MAMTNAGMRALRAAATLADVVPSVRIRLRDGERPLCTVTRTPSPTGDDVAVLPPCVFRAAVGKAHRLQRRGAKLCFLDVAAEREPAVDIGLRAEDAVLPGQIYRIRAGADGQYLFLFMTDLDVQMCERVTAEALHGLERNGTGQPGDQDQCSARPVGFHADSVTELTVVHTMSTVIDADATRRVLTRILEACVAVEAITELQAVPSFPHRDMTP